MSSLAKKRSSTVASTTPSPSPVEVPQKTKTRIQGSGGEDDIWMQIQTLTSRLQSLEAQKSSFSQDSAKREKEQKSKEKTRKLVKAMQDDPRQISIAARKLRKDSSDTSPAPNFSVASNAKEEAKIQKDNLQDLKSCLIVLEEGLEELEQFEIPSEKSPVLALTRSIGLISACLLRTRSRLWQLEAEKIAKELPSETRRALIAEYWKSNDLTGFKKALRQECREERAAEAHAYLAKQIAKPKPPAQFVAKPQPAAPTPRPQRRGQEKSKPSTSKPSEQKKNSSDADE